MNRGSPDRSAFEFHRLEDRDGIDKAGPARAPFHVDQRCLHELIRPLESNGIAGELGGCAKRLAVCDVIEREHKSVGRKIARGDLLLEFPDLFRHIIRRDAHVFHRLKSLVRQEFHLLLSGVVKREIPGLYQRKSVKSDPALSSDPVVELPDTAAAQIPGILVAHIGQIARGCRFRFQLFVDLLEVRVTDQGLSAQDDRLFAGNVDREILEHLGVVGDHFPDLAVSPGHRFCQLPVLIGEYNGEAVQLPGQKSLVAAKPLRKGLPVLCLVQGQHRAFVPLFGQLIRRGITDMNRRRSGKHNTGARFQRGQLVIKPVVFEIAHDLGIFVVIGFRCAVKELRQLFHSGAVRLGYFSGYTFHGYSFSTLQAGAPPLYTAPRALLR